MQHAADETVLGDFRDTEFEHFGHTWRFFRKDGGFWVNAENSEGKRENFRVAYTVGIRPLQQYLLEFPGGRLQALQVCWDSRPSGEGGQRWFHLYPKEEIPPSDVLHWTRRHFNWNYMCADCHSTNLAKRYDPDRDSYATTWSDMNVSCEACHGPGSQHIAWAQSGHASDLDGKKGLLVKLSEPVLGAWGLDPGTGQPKRNVPLSSQVQLDICAPCHSHRQPLQPKKFAGQSYLDSYTASVLDRALYHGDGQIMEEVYEYGSFVQSKMYHNSVRCTDCHQPHTMKLQAEGNNLCIRCHQPAKYDSTAHHFHQPGSTGASCVECHMPPKYYMVVDKRRDHSIRIPRPDLSRAYGTPNACTGCHTDRDAEWASEAFVKWWGDRPRPSHGEILAKGRRDPAIWERELDMLARSSTMPGIARASALQLLGEAPSERTLTLAKERLSDGEPLVRRQAVTVLAAVPPGDRWAAAGVALRDPVRAVRVEAARILAGTPREGLTADDQLALSSGIGEYIEMQDAAADVPESRMAMADLYLTMGEPAKAELAYRKAIELDPLFVPARVNLAEYLYGQGRMEEAEPVLREGVSLRPDDGYAHEAWGRFEIRRKHYEEGVAALRRAVELLPDRADLCYFTGVGLNTLGRFDDALSYLQRALELEPRNREYLSGIAAICRDAGREDLARDYLKRQGPQP
jgi:predicted CXXCH cytochrome family protein